VQEFDILGGYMTNVFSNLTNVVCRLHFGGRSSGATSRGEPLALLLNAHFDTPLESEGAMDDRVSIGVMLETLRALIYTDDVLLEQMKLA
jgi:Zn-dependent M28 family amino/carboxypeptidase